MQFFLEIEKLYKQFMQMQHKVGSLHQQLTKVVHKLLTLKLLVVPKQHLVTLKFTHLIQAELLQFQPLVMQQGLLRQITLLLLVAHLVDHLVNQEMMVLLQLFLPYHPLAVVKVVKVEVQVILILVVMEALVVAVVAVVLKVEAQVTLLP